MPLFFYIVCPRDVEREQEYPRKDWEAISQVIAAKTKGVFVDASGSLKL
jgi:hypothetical protein